MKDRIEWTDYFMSIAKIVSKRSTCRRRQIGAVAVLNNRILTTGYNGAPKGYPHCLDVGCLRDALSIASGTMQESCLAIHAEQNLICQAAVVGVSLFESTIFCTTRPCSICAKMLANIGVEKVIYEGDYPDDLTESFLPGKLIQYKG